MMNMRKQIYILSTLLTLFTYGCKHKEEATQIKSVASSHFTENQFDSLLIKEKKLLLIQNRERLMCSKINFKFIAEERKGYLSSLIIYSDSLAIDTIDGLSEKRILLYDNGTISLIKEDYNFDNLCDFIIIDDGSASHGTMSHYYFLYDLTTKKFIEDKSLPHRTPGVEIDKVNKKIIVYCSYKDCKGSYEFIDNKFKLVDGEYTNEP